MDFMQRKPKPRPFAANSTGRPRGTLKLGSRIGRFQVYEAIGEAREIFINELSHAIVSHLNDNSDKLQDSASFVDLSLFMMGKSPDRTKPMVMFVSDDKQVRTEAFRMIKNSDIMKDYPDFGLGEMELKAEFENLRPLGSQTDSATVRALGARTTSFVVPEESIDVFATNTLPWDEGRPLQLKAQTGLGSRTRLAAACAGGVVCYRGFCMLHSVHHFLPAARRPQRVVVRRPSPTPDESDSEDECEVVGLSDDEDEDDRPLTIMSHGIATPAASDSESTSSSPLASEAMEGSISSHGSCEDPDTSLSPLQCALETLSVEAPSTKGPSTRIGHVTLESALLDSALVLLSSEIEFDVSRVRDMAIPLESYLEHIKTRPSDAAVKTSTPNGTIGGTLSGTPSFVRLPGSRVFQEVYTAMLDSPPMAGDCGSWVKHAVSGKLFGHIVAGSPTTGLVLVMPAVKVFAEALAALSDQEVRLQQVKLIPRVGLPPFLDSRIEMACGEFVGNLGDDAGQSNRDRNHEGLSKKANGFGTIYALPPPRRLNQERLIRPYVPPPPTYVDSPSFLILGPPSNGTQQDATPSIPAAATPKNLVSISDLRRKRPLTVQEAREAVSDYFIFRFTAADAGDSATDGPRRKPSWKRARRIEVPRISKHEAARTIRQLDRKTIPVTDKIQSLSEDAKRQIEITLENLQREHDNTTFRTTLAQLDEEMREIPKEESSREQGRRKKRYRKEFGLFDTSRRRKEPSMLGDRGRVTMERMSLTAYFKREPRPDVDPFPLLHSRNNQGGSAESRIPYAHSASPFEDEVHPPLSAVDAGVSSPVAHRAPVYNQGRLVTVVQQPKERPGHTHSGPYTPPPRPSSPSTDQPVFSETFSASDGTSCTSVSNASCVSKREFSERPGPRPPARPVVPERPPDYGRRSTFSPAGRYYARKGGEEVLIQQHRSIERGRRADYSTPGSESLTRLQSVSLPEAQGRIAFSHPEGPAHDWALPKSSSQPPHSHTSAPIRIWPSGVDAAAPAPTLPPGETAPSKEQLRESTLIPLAPAGSTVPLTGPSMLLSTRESRDSGYSDGAEDKTAAIAEQTTHDFAKYWKEELPGWYSGETAGAEQAAEAFDGYWKSPLPGWHLPFDVEEPGETSGEVKIVVNERRERCMSVSSDLGEGQNVGEYLARRAQATK
jgi:hypothetical protein